MKILWKDKFKEKDKIVYWIREWFEKNGNPETKAIIGISGGKDSTVCAALCVEALGKGRVVGVLMPNGDQKDIEDARKVIDILDIEHFEINIESTLNALYGNINKAVKDTYGCPNMEPEMPYSVAINTPPRIRMTILYAMAASNGRVICTDNASESYVGYSTKYGDLAGDVAPLAEIPATLVVDIGRAIAYTMPDLLPLVEKTPSDGLCGRTDEENLGFSYEDLDNYLFNCSESIANSVIDSIEAKHASNAHKDCIFIPRYRAIINDSINPDIEDTIFAET